MNNPTHPYNDDGEETYTRKDLDEVCESAKTVLNSLNPKRLLTDADVLREISKQTLFAPDESPPKPELTEHHACVLDHFCYLALINAEKIQQAVA